MISIICPCYNAGCQLERMIASVLCQTSTDYELVIVDGMSNDGATVDILRKHDGDERITIAREKDCGLYDAMNKGVKMSKGEWLYFIGADDRLANAGVLESINTCIHASADAGTDADMIVGRALLDGKERVYTLDWRIYLENTLLHQCAFYRRRVFDDFAYIPDYTVSSDYDLNFCLYKKHAKVEYTDTVICEYATAGVSSNVRWKSYKEEIDIRSKHIRSSFVCLLLSLYSVARFSWRRARKRLS